MIIAGSQGPCRFGSDCLIAGFGIFGFPTQPTRFTCEFNDGSRYTYRFDTELIGYACATARRGGTITIEVEGVRSETLTRDAD